MRVSFITGIAGSGKTTLLKHRIEADPLYGQLCASTGIASINLNTITIHSLLSFIDLESLKDAYTTGKLLKRIRKVADEGYRNIILDEVSMFSSHQLEIIYQAIKEVNHIYTKDLGFIICGDMCQLPPIKEPFCFEARCWNEFSANTTRLTKIWRQSDESFISALNFARSGNGSSCIDTLIDSCNLTLESSLDQRFKGTTIVAKNDQVDRYNWLRLNEIKDKPSIRIKKEIRGLPSSDWKKIPDEVELKVGAYIMLLSNKYEYQEGSPRPEIVYANGDAGIIKDYNSVCQTFVIELERNHQEVNVGHLTRYNSQRSKPDNDLIKEIFDKTGHQVYQERIGGDLVWILGEIDYLPMRLAYCSTVWKSQGLSLQKVQFDYREHFSQTPGLCYVALSRCTSSQGLRLIGGKDLFIKRCRIDERVRSFI